MGEVLKFYGPGDIRFDSYDEVSLAPGEVRIKTLFSGISAGTEMTHYRGTNPFRNKLWDEERNLFLSEKNPDYYPRGTGYEEVGTVVEIGNRVSTVKVGDIVFGAWQHKTTHRMEESQAKNQLLLPELDPIQGIFAQIGAIALNGILDASVNVGETVAIFGLGVVGLICVKLAKISGADVVAVDPIAERLEYARTFGADYLFDPGSVSVGEEVRDITKGIGADCCIEVSGNSGALHEAIRACSYGGTVIALGFYQGGAQGVYLGEEFHHNRIRIHCSQIGGISGELRDRWDRERLDSTIMQLQKSKTLKLKELITHERPFREALELYKTIDTTPQQVVQSVLTF